MVKGTFNLGDMGSKPDVANKGDGYWKIISDWSSCSVACGGGTQTQQRQCIPPAPGKAPCSGPEILNRPCNTQNCPNSTSDVPPDHIQVAPAVFKTVRISNDFQTNERCVKILADVDVEVPNSGGGSGARLPHKMVVNNRTLSIFTSSNVQDIDWII